ncbi:FxSxx-COOH cyclophane-containing RiPP peptide [Streptomyces sp. H10-C2]|uniref:FxSxx-COOH cyclophane-containing RiPP peptide n=1 Tax=unclassified Streptomyces TaxID=2593676 RepID=UPI0024B8A268|nr:MULTISPECIES: FxSxx-COOH cyclophane-containing RiPP peptide [unclassified Streptomyces]MDJ0343136.1 FxSxx-COOH cyclophane-containing RiPP peptide [Streptomyces sp. PH10-H1]MDJ0371078.1 FxSxx-COOH cyclophane-containing RiPP peptide [Streptomyces sp. H10-C2]
MNTPANIRYPEVPKLRRVPLERLDAQSDPGVIKTLRRTLPALERLTPAVPTFQSSL